jgi:hypothetical protein
MAGKITDYPTMTTLASGDLLDVSDYDGVSAFVSKSIDWDVLKTNIEGQITFTNLYTTDGTLAGNRIVSMGVNDLTFGSTGDANLLRFDSTSDRVGIGTATPTEKLEIVGNIFVQQSNYVHTSLTIQSKIANNRGNVIELTESGGINLNNYNNQLGAGVGTQDLNANFVHYNFKSANHAGATADDVSHLWFDLNLNNTAPTTRMGINGVNSSTRTLLELRLDKIGALATNAEPIVSDIVDDWGVHSVDMAGGTFVKTGYKSSLTGVFETSTTGSGIVRALWANAENGDENQALFIENGLIVSPNMPTSSAGLPTGAIWNNSGVINII